ncbi:endoribonuclease MazF [Aminivibrio sp.]
MAVKNPFPDRGDIVLADLKPVKGQEQGGESRPALVLSPFEYNIRSGLCLIVPLTHRRKGYPYEADTDGFSMKTEGVILTDAVRSIDWKSRNVRFLEEADPDFVQEVLSKLLTLLVQA